jgi:hypothetical protein
MATPWMVGIASFAFGAVLASGAWIAFPPRTAVAVKDDAGAVPADEGALGKANANLTESLQACDRQLADLRSGQPPSPIASVARPAEDGGERGGRRRERGETTREDWDRMAQLGVVRVRIPCIRDTPWKPTQRVVDRLGLAPQDVKTLEEAYGQSNKRVQDQIKTLCAGVLGGPALADKVGPTACIDAIQNSAKKADPKAAKDALTRAAEVQSGKRPAGKDEAAPLEQLALVLANESKAFENDLAQKLGPDEAKRLANDSSLCTDRRTLRASDEPAEPAERRVR